MLDPRAIRQLADELGLKPTKQRGQNFVHDANTVRRIVAAAGVGLADVVLEIGPGLGSLTLGLLDAVSSVTAIEIDEVLAAALPTTVARFGGDGGEAGGGASGRVGAAERLRVVAADALRVTELSGPAPTALVANLPYNVSVPVLLHVLEHFSTIETGLVMVQLEVAERLVAAPGSKIYGVPSVKLGWWCAARIIGTVPRNVFWPVPNVESGLVALRRRPTPSVGSRKLPSRRLVFAVVDAAFGQRRKMLRSTLAPMFGTAAAASAACERAGVDPTRRGETLVLTDFIAIAEQLPK